MAEISDSARAHLQNIAPDVLFRTEATIGRHSVEDQGRIRSAWNALLRRRTDESLEIAKGLPADVGINLRKRGEQIGLKRNATTGAIDRSPGSPEEAVYKRYMQALDAALAYGDVSRGYDKIDPAQQVRIRNTVRDMFLRDRGQIGKAFSALSAAERDAAVSRILQNPSFARHVQEGLVAQQGKMTPALDHFNAQVQPSAHVDTQTERDRLITDAEGNAQAASDLLARARGTGGLTDAQRGPQVNEGTEEVKSLRNELRILRNDMTRLNGEALAANLKLQENVMGNITALIKNNQSLLPSVTDVENRNITRRQEHIAALTQRAQQRIEGLAANANLSDIETNRAIEEEGLTHGMEEIFAEAAYKTVLEDLNFSIQALEENEPKVGEKEHKAIVEGLSSHLQNTRWRRRVMRRRGLFRRRREEWRINTAQVNQDFDILNARGPEALLRHSLRNVRTRGSGGFPRILTAHQIDHIMQDSKFVKEWGGQIAQQVLSRRSLFRPYRPSEVHHIMNAPWGKDMIQHAYETNEAYRMQVQALNEVGEMDLDNPSFRRNFAIAATQHPGLLRFLPTTVPWLASDRNQMVEQSVDRYRLAA